MCFIRLCLSSLFSSKNCAIIQRVQMIILSKKNTPISFPFSFSCLFDSLKINELITFMQIWLRLCTNLCDIARLREQQKNWSRSKHNRTIQLEKKIQSNLFWPADCFSFAFARKNKKKRKSKTIHNVNGNEEKRKQARISSKSLRLERVDARIDLNFYRLAWAQHGAHSIRFR